MKRISLLGVPCSLGGRENNGTEEGPRALISAGIEHYLHERGYDTHYKNLQEWSSFSEIWTADEISIENPKHGRKIAAVNACVAAQVFSAFQFDDIPVLLGGDHSMVIGSVTQAVARYGDRLGVICFDSHRDSHVPETSPAHNANGMPFAAVMGYGYSGFTELVGSHPLKPEHFMHIGAGNSFCEPEELEFFRKHNIRSIPISVFRDRQKGIRFASHELRDFIARHDYLHMSCDIDFLHKRWAPGVDYPAENGNGMWWPHALRLAEETGQSGKVVSIDMVEYKPSSDRKNRKGKLITAESMIKLLVAFLGPARPPHV